MTKVNMRDVPYFKEKSFFHPTIWGYLCSSVLRRTERYPRLHYPNINYSGSGIEIVNYPFLLYSYDIEQLINLKV